MGPRRAARRGPTAEHMANMGADPCYPTSHATSSRTAPTPAPRDDHDPGGGGRGGVAVYDGGSPTRWAAAAEPRPANVPPISDEEADRPLGVPPRSSSSSAGYRFTFTHPNGTPVAYDPCRPVHFVTRPTGAPPGCAELLAAAIAEVSRATGLTFVDDGTTSEAPSAERAPYQPDRYGQRWAPVLIAWQTPSDNPNFAAAVTGEAGSIPVAWSGHPRAYVTGTVQLDATKFTRCSPVRKASSTPTPSSCTNWTPGRARPRHRPDPAHVPRKRPRRHRVRSGRPRRPGPARAGTLHPLVVNPQGSPQQDAGEVESTAPTRHSTGVATPRRGQMVNCVGHGSTKTARAGVRAFAHTQDRLASARPASGDAEGADPPGSADR